MPWPSISSIWLGKTIGDRLNMILRNIRSRRQGSEQLLAQKETRKGRTWILQHMERMAIAAYT